MYIYIAFLNIHRSGVLTALAWLVPHETAAVSARSVYTIQPCTIQLALKDPNRVYRFWSFKVSRTRLLIGVCV